MRSAQPKIIFICTHTLTHTDTYIRAATGKPIQMAKSLNLKDFCVGSATTIIDSLEEGRKGRLALKN